MTSQSHVLVVDDDASLGRVLKALLEQDGLEATHALSAESALGELRRKPFDAVLTDLRMPGMDGMELLRTIAREWPGVPVIMLTAHGSVPLAVGAMRAGATDFMLKPFDRDEVLYTIRKALTGSRHVQEQPPERAMLQRTFVGSSKAMEAVAQMIQKTAGSQTTVLILGESGTGKELAARAVHEESPRAAGPFVPVHCAALPENLLESELFGYEKGAFTGANTRKPGRVELANGGTLFLDEIGEVPPLLQAKLLRVLQEKEYQPLGGTRIHQADVRFVAATHRDLEAMVREGTFREDLFYRLNVVPIRMPSLRERPEDIAALAPHFCEKLCEQNQRPAMRLDESAVRALEAHPWPGNVRQLQNVVERLVILCDGPVLTAKDVAMQLGNTAAVTASSLSTAPAHGAVYETKRKEAEREAVVEALGRARNNRSVAARILGVSRRTLYNKLAEFGLS